MTILDRDADAHSHSKILSMLGFSHPCAFRKALELPEIVQPIELSDKTPFDLGEVLAGHRHFD